jgi:hypothetical protein
MVHQKCKISQEEMGEIIGKSTGIMGFSIPPMKFPLHNYGKSPFSMGKTTISIKFPLLNGFSNMEVSQL